jgi:hypothetical protein
MAFVSFALDAPSALSATLTTTRAVNVAPGAADYPEVNPHPHASLTLVAWLPESLPIEFRAAYIADWPAGPSNDHCSYRHDGESLQAISLLEPIAVSRSGNRVSASIARDRYLRGSCGWHFIGIQYALVNSSGEMTSDWFAIQYDALRDGTDRRNLPRRAPKIWCTRNRDESEHARPELCSTLSHLQLVANIPAPLLATIASEDRNRGMIWLFPGDRRVTIQFYDLDDMSVSSADGH